MSDNEKREQQEVEAYEPPAIIAEETFESLSLTCGKTSTASATCRPPLGSLQNS